MATSLDLASKSFFNQPLLTLALDGPLAPRENARRACVLVINEFQVLSRELINRLVEMNECGAHPETKQVLARSIELVDEFICEAEAFTEEEKKSDADAE